MQHINELLVKALVLMHQRSSGHKDNGMSCEVCVIGDQLEQMMVDQSRADNISEVEAATIGNLVDIEQAMALEAAILTIQSVCEPYQGIVGKLAYRIPHGDVSRRVKNAVTYLLFRKAARIQGGDGQPFNVLVLVLHG